MSITQYSCEIHGVKLSPIQEQKSDISYYDTVPFLGGRSREFKCHLHELGALKCYNVTVATRATSAVSSGAARSRTSVCGLHTTISLTRSRFSGLPAMVMRIIRGISLGQDKSLFA